MEKLEHVKGQPRKKYSPPKLTKYGTVQELTQKIGSHGRPDGGTFPRNKTSV
jgi:hypothetical protein